MAHYLVRAKPKEKRLDELQRKLKEEVFRSLRPFGNTLHHSLKNARQTSSGDAVWEEEDYCSPPLAQEREAVLDEYFSDIQVESVQKGKGWQEIEDLPYLFPSLIKNQH